jgi:hypothetical protein
MYQRESANSVASRVTANITHPCHSPLSSCSNCQLESMAVGTSRQLQVDAPSVSLNLLVATLTTFDRPIDLPTSINISTHPYFSYRVPVSVDWTIDRLSKLKSHFSSPSSNLHAVSWFVIDVELLQLTLITIFLRKALLGQSTCQS